MAAETIQNILGNEYDDANERCKQISVELLKLAPGEQEALRQELAKELAVQHGRMDAVMNTVSKMLE